MRLIVDDERALTSISATTLATYLADRGWNKVGEIPERSLVYKAIAHGRDWGIHVPVKDTFPDHADTIAEAIDLLTQVEMRDHLEVFRDLSSAGADTITISALHANKGQTLSVHDAGHLLSDTHALLSWSARAAVESRPAFRGPTPHDAMEFLRHLTPLPMAFDEFKLVLFSPVPTAVGQPKLEDVPERREYGGLPEPFSRQAALKLASSLRATGEGIDEAKRKNDLAPLTRKFPQGVSANFCGTLAEMIERGSEFGSGININLAWAAVLPALQLKKVNAEFSQHDSEILRAARLELLAKAPYMDEHVVAEVVRLEREPDEFDGKALVIAELDGQDRRLQVEFDENDFETVIAAFRERRLIELEGDIFSSGRSYLLQNPRNVGLAG